MNIRCPLNEWCDTSFFNSGLWRALLARCRAMRTEAREARSVSRNHRHVAVLRRALDARTRRLTADRGLDSVPD
jgi:hypothetical protein